MVEKSGLIGLTDHAKLLSNHAMTMNYPDPTAIRVNGSYVRVLLDWLDQYQLSAPTLRAAVSRLAPGEQVPLIQWLDLLRRAYAVHPGDGRGLEIGACISPDHVGVLGYLVQASDNLGQALYAYQRFESLFYGIRMAEVVIRGDEAEIGWPVYGGLSLGLLVDETAISALISFLRKIVPDAPNPAEGAFSSPTPDHPAV